MENRSLANTLKRGQMNVPSWDPMYPERHREIIDYSPYTLTSANLRFRGPDPRPLPKGEYVTFIGSAHTFGCFCEKPYPLLLQEKLGVVSLNLGYGGVGPSFFNKHPELIDLANAGRLVVLQVMSARCESNSRMYSHGHIIVFDRKLGRWVRAEEVWYRILFGDHPLSSYAKRYPSADLALRIISLFYRKTRRSYIEKVINETREEWVRQYTLLIKKLHVPKILFWFSTRTPDYDVNYNSLSLKGIFGEFPQLVNREMVREIAKLCDAYVECVSREGLPQLLRSRFNGKPVYIPPLLPEEKKKVTDPVWILLRLIRKMRGKGCLQNYYPSPEMHRKAADMLEPVILRFLR